MMTSPQHTFTPATSSAPQEASGAPAHSVGPSVPKPSSQGALEPFVLVRILRKLKEHLNEI